MNRTPLNLLVLAAGLAFPVPTGAQAPAVSIDELMVARSPVIVFGEVRSAGWAATDPSFTDSLLAIEDVLKGYVGGSQILVRHPGGGSGGRIDGERLALAEGDRVLLFLGDEESGAYPIAEYPLGMFWEARMGGRALLLGWGAAAGAGAPAAGELDSWLRPRDATRFRQWIADRVAGVAQPPAYYTTQASGEAPIAESSVPSSSSAPCTPTSDVFRFDGGYQVRLCYRTHNGDVGQARSGLWASSQAGLIWFFSRENPEALVKVLDGCAFNQQRWVFFAPLTDLGLHLQIKGPTDTWTYTNPVGRVAPAAADTSAFSCADENDQPDLVVESTRVNDSSLRPNQGFSLSATVVNKGNGGGSITTLRYYRSFNSTITMSDTEVGTDAVRALGVPGTSAESIALRAPGTAGTYYYGACVDPVAGESNAGNNCTPRGVRVVVSSGGGSTAPDLVVSRVSASVSTVTADEVFSFRATVANQGNGAAAATTLRYYRSGDSTISRSDLELGTDGVDALAAGRQGTETAPLRAASAADTWYYGACVDSVSGESNTANNCSTSVRITVTGGPPTDMPFDLDTGNDYAYGITYANGHFYVVDERDDKVYAYSSSGGRVTSADFDLDTDNRNPGGITYVNDRFLVTDTVDDKVYAYSSSGGRVTSADFDLPFTDRAYGITYASGRFYLVDDTDNKVYAYSNGGGRVASADFDLDTRNARPFGITYIDGRFYVADITDDKVYVYSTSGAGVTSFDLDSGNRAPAGMTYTDGHLYVVDLGDDSVYVYSGSEGRVTDFDFEMPFTERPQGITYANGHFYVVDDTDDKVYAYSSSGEHVTSADFDLDSLNRDPYGITYANGRFYVADINDDEIYVYSSSGGGLTGFDLDSANQAPSGMTYANGRLYVLDLSDDKVYAYSSSGVRVTSADFDLDSRNGDAYGITYANGRFYVVDQSDDKVYAYTSSGGRATSADFDLDDYNLVPSGIMYANGRFYVVDIYDDKVYVYSSSGAR